MPQVKFIEFNGTKHNIDANNGDSIMVTATSNLVPGIDADCGGECSCATCHVLISAKVAGEAGSHQRHRGINARSQSG